MPPPHGSPGRHATSSAPPKFSSRGAPSSITSSAAVMTSPSTQPPEAEPKKTPDFLDDEMRSSGPWRGAERLNHGGDRDAALQFSP